jgi:hypothetical protein
MENTPNESLIRAYLRKELSASEQAHFESQLKTNIDFQKAYLSFCLRSEGQKEMTMEDRLREMAESVRAEIGPIPEPRLTWWDHVRLRMYQPLFRGIATGLSIVLGAFFTLLIWANTGGVDSVANLVEQYRILPACEIRDQEKAGKPSGQPLPDLTEILQRSKQFYCEGAMDGLLANADTLGISDYYIAQLQLKAKDWKSARQNLEKCLANDPFLQQFSRIFDPAEMRFNLLLARLGSGDAYGQIRPALEELISDKSTGKMVQDKARALREEMESPLRRCYFR